MQVNAAEERCYAASDQETVQKAVDSLGSEGGTVVVPRWNARAQRAMWRFQRPVCLRSHVTVVLDNALIVQKTGCFAPLFTAEAGAEKIALIGEGNAMLSGGKTSRLKTTTAGKYGLPDIECAAMCIFRKASDLSIENLEISDPHWFAFVLEDVKEVTVKNVRFHSCPVVPEEGGILIRGGTREVLIENLTGRTGFDTIHITADQGEVSGIRVRNILTDPTRGALMTIRTGTNGTVHDVGLDVLMDSSDFYEKARSGACAAFGRLDHASGTEDSIFRVRAENLYSRAVNAVEILQPFSETHIENLMTFGDNIFAIGSRSEQRFKLKDVVFEHVFYGAGSEPNNASSFISRAAKGAKAVDLKGISGVETRHLYMPEEA